MAEKKVERFTYEDGRSAERHFIVDENGNERIEVYVEERRPLKLEKRIENTYKQVLSEQKVETVDVNGNVVDVKVQSLEPNVKMQLRDHIAVAEDAVLNANSYVTHDQMKEAVKEGVLVGISALMDHQAQAQSIIVPKAEQQGKLWAQDAVEARVEEKNKKRNTLIVVGLSVVVLVEVVLSYFML